MLEQLRAQKRVWSAIYDILSKLEPETWYTYKQIMAICKPSYMQTRRMIKLLKEQNLLKELGKTERKFILTAEGVEVRQHTLKIGNKLSIKNVRKAFKKCP